MKKLLISILLVAGFTLFTNFALGSYLQMTTTGGGGGPDTTSIARNGSRTPTGAQDWNSQDLTNVANFSTSTATVNGLLSGQDQTPQLDDTYSLGSALLRYRDGFFSNELTVGSSIIISTNTIRPSVFGGALLGTLLFPFSDLNLAGNIHSDALTADTALVVGPGNYIQSATTTRDQIEFLNTLSSNVQDQLDAKAASGVNSDITQLTATTDIAVQSAITLGLDSSGGAGILSLAEGDGSGGANDRVQVNFGLSSQAGYFRADSAGVQGLTLQDFTGDVLGTTTSQILLKRNTRMFSAGLSVDQFFNVDGSTSLDLTTINGTLDSPQLTVQSAATQTANLVEFQNNVGSVKVAFTDAGDITSQGQITSANGVKSNYFQTNNASVSSAGVIGLANNEAIGWRNFADTGNETMYLDPSDIMQFSSNVQMAQNLTVDGKLTVTGAIDPTYIELTQISTPSNPAAGKNRFYCKAGDFCYTKNSAGSETQIATTSAALTGSRVLESTSGGLVVASSTTSTENSYLQGVTSAIQTQINSKAGKGANSDITSMSGLTGNIAATTTNSSDIGTSSLQMRTGYFGTSMEVGKASSLTGAVNVRANATPATVNLEIGSTGGNVAAIYMGTGGVGLEGNATNAFVRGNNVNLRNLAGSDRVSVSTGTAFYSREPWLCFDSDNNSQCNIGKSTTGGGTQRPHTAAIGTQLELASHVWRQGTATTTDATATTLFTDAISFTAAAFSYEVLCTAIRTDSAGRASYGKAFLTYISGGTVTQQGTTMDRFLDIESDVTWGGVTVATSGANVLIQVTGAASQTINWKCTIERTFVE